MRRELRVCIKKFDIYNGHCLVDDHDVDDDYFRSLLISFWADINKQKFLVSTDKRDMYALWRMMAFLDPVFNRVIISKSADLFSFLNKIYFYTSFRDFLRFLTIFYDFYNH